METDVEKGLRLAFELFEAGARMMEQNLRRRFPSADSDEIQDRLAAWLAERPGARWGDSSGRPVLGIEGPE